MSVGQCWTRRRPCFTLSVIQKNLIAICLDLPEQDIFPFYAILCAPSLSFHSRLLSRVYPWASMKYWNHILKGRYSLLPITSVLFELREFIFCLLDFTLTTPVPNVIVPLVWPFMSSCTACDKSMKVYIFSRLSAPTILTLSIVWCRKLMIRFKFFQSSTSRLFTRVHRKSTAGEQSIRPRWQTHSNFATSKLNVSTRSPFNFLALLTAENQLLAGVDTIYETSSPKSSTTSWM